MLTHVANIGEPLWCSSDNVVDDALDAFAEEGTTGGEVDAGTNLYAVQQMLGHKDISIPQIYANMADESKRESVNRISLKAASTL